MKLLTSILALASCGLMVSCYPVYPPQHGPGYNRPNPVKKDVAEEVMSEKDRQLADSQARLEEEARLKAERERKEAQDLAPKIEGDKPDIGDVAKDKPKLPKNIKFGAPVPNKPGFLFNPYTHNQVDARGVPSGTKIRDPNDPDPTHVFRVP